MKNYMTFLLFIFFQFSYAQLNNQNPYLSGCENAKNKIAKNYCKSTNFSDLYTEKFGEILEKYGELIPEGEAKLEFTIFEDGNFGNAKIIEQDNPEFGQISLRLLNDIFKEFNRFGLKFKFFDNQTEAKKLQFIIQNKISK